MSDPIITNCLNCGYDEFTIGGKCVNCGYLHIFSFDCKSNLPDEDLKVESRAFLPEHAAISACGIYDDWQRQRQQPEVLVRTVTLTEKQSGKRFVIRCESYVKKHWKAV